MSDRKYRQHGYMDRGEERPQGKPPGQGGAPRLKKDETFGPRPLAMPGTRTVSRCAQCGVVINMLGELPATCAKCGFPLHSCKQCVHFDPAARYECRQPIAERVAKKDQANTCTFYTIKTAVERETSTGNVRPADARAAFENLFKKL